MFECLPGFTDGAQYILSEDSGMDMLICPQRDILSYFSQAEVAASHGQSTPSANFNDLETCHDDLILNEIYTEKMCTGIEIETTSENENFIMKTTSETSETISVPDKCQNKLSTRKIDAWSVEAAGFQNANKQKTLLQRTGQLKPASKAYFQPEQNICEHFKGNHVSYLINDDIASKQDIEEHEFVEGLSTLEAFNKSEILISMQNEGNSNLYFNREEIISMSKAVISPMQHAEEHERFEACLALGGAGRKPNPVDIKANREETSENVNQSLHFSMEVHVKADKHEESSEKQPKNFEQCVSPLVTDIASRQHNDECIDNGKVSILKSLNKPDGGVKEGNLIDEEKPYKVTNLPSSTVSKGGARLIPYDGSSNFNIGDLVWAKVRSHPWWPAQVFNPLYASEAARKLEQSGRLLIAFFGDHTFAWLQKSQLIAFQPTFEKKVKQTDNKIFCRGVAEALEEFCKISELGLVCQHYKGSLPRLSTSSTGQSGSHTFVSTKDCKLNFESAKRVKPAKILEFIKSMALNPFGSSRPSLEAAELRGHAYGLRACMVALVTTDLLQDMQAAERSPIHRNQQKRNFFLVDSGAGAEEVSKKVRTSDITETKRLEDGAESLLALACYHPKFLKSLEKQSSKKDLPWHPATNTGCRQTLAQVHALEPVSGSESSSKATMNTAMKVYCRRKKSKAQDACGFTTSESEENLCEAGNKDPKRRKRSCSAEVQKLTRSERSEAKQFKFLSSKELDDSDSSGVEKPREIEMSNPENKATNFAHVGNSTSKVAIRLTETPLLQERVDKVLDKTSKLRSKKNVIGSSAKTRSSSKLDKAVLQESSLHGWHFSTVQLHQSLKLLARDPWNKAEMIRSPCVTEILLRFRVETVKTKDRTNALLDDVGRDEAVSLEDAWVENKDAWKGDQLISKALDTPASKTCIELLSEHSKDSLQAPGKGKSKFTRRTSAKSSKKGSTSTSIKRLYSPVPEVREPTEARPLENNGELFLGETALAASNTQRNDMKVCAPLQLGIFIQFPEDFTLPSEAQLKAMFLCFGPIEPSGVTVFKDLASAQVVFTHGEDAKAAYRHVKKISMFGHAFLKYKLCNFSSPLKWKESSTVYRGSSSRAPKRASSHKDQRMSKCLKLATSLKDRVNGHLRAVSDLSWKGTKNGQENISMQYSGHGKVPSTERSFDSFEDALQERMMTLLRRVSVIVGTPKITVNTD